MNLVKVDKNCKQTVNIVAFSETKYSLQETTQSRYLTGGIPPVRFSM